jgi:regulator of protease activity HflC (stomatin/prohibitin superfamily)
MFGIRYLKAPPTTYILFYKKGRLRRAGAGLSFLYFAPTSTVVAVPFGSADVPFVFNEVSADFQAVTVQGQLTYRIAEPERLAALLDFSQRPDGRPASDDPEVLKQRLVHITQLLAQSLIGRLGLREALAGSERLTTEILTGLQSSEALTQLGIEVLALSILSVRPTPEMARALEAEAREALLRNADLAVYARRNSAVEQERLIKESELSTEVAVAEKQREIRHAQLAGEIAAEEQREGLIERRSANDRKEADSRAYALESTLRPLKEMDWRTLVSVGAGGNDPNLNIALAFRELAANATKIGELNVSPELLASLAGKRK